MKKFEVKEGHELRGFLVKLYPTKEQEEALLKKQDATRLLWNELVHRADDANAAIEAFAIREGLVTPKPKRPDYDGLSPDDSRDARKAYESSMSAWAKSVFEVTRGRPECSRRTVKDYCAHFGFKQDYQWLMSRHRQGPLADVTLSAHELQALVKNFYTKSTRRKKHRRRHDSMPMQVRSGAHFFLGDFGQRRGKTFYNCAVGFPSIGKIAARLPGRVPPGRVLEGVTITNTAGEWVASLKVEVAARELPPVEPGRVVGLDVGLDFLVATSDGLRVSNDRGKAFSERIAGRQAFSRTIESAEDRRRYEQTTWRMQRRAARRVRHEYYSRVMPHVATAEVIKLEKLPAHIGQMGSVKVSTMRTLKNMLVERYGDRVREVDPRFTSQDCSQCGHRSKESWSYAHGRFGECPACGHREDRDVNAARNIASRPSISKAA